MPCRGLRTPQGDTLGIVCIRGGRGSRAKRCVDCHRLRAYLLCDGSRPDRRSGTCDAPVCEDCATRAGELDFCAVCAERRGEVPAQASLF